MTEKEQEVAALIDGHLCRIRLYAKPARVEVVLGAVALRADYYPLIDTLRLKLPEDWKEAVHDAGIATPDETHLVLRARSLLPPVGAEAAWRVALWNGHGISGQPDEKYIVRFAGDLHYGTLSPDHLVELVCEAMAADMNGELPF